MNADPARRVVDALVEARLLESSSREAATRVVAGSLGAAAAPATASAESGADGRGLPRLVEVVAYLGGSLVLAAGALFVAQEWEQLGFAARVALLAVVSLVLLVAGGVVARGASPRRTPAAPSSDVRRRLAGALLGFGALATAFLVGHVVDELASLSDRDVYWPAMLGAFAGAVVASLGYRLAPTALGLVAVLGGLVTATASFAPLAADHEGTLAGVLLLALGALWLGATELGWFGELTVARVLGVVVTLVGAQVPVLAGTDVWLGYLMTAALVAVGLALYLRSRDWPYLAVAVLATTLVVPEAVSDWTEGSLGAVGGVLVTGLTLLLASFAGYRIRAGTTD